MEWRKEVIINRNLNFARSTLIILIILTFLFGDKWLLFILLTAVILLFIHHVYISVLGRDLHLENDKEITRMNIDDEGAWLFTFKNKGVPIVKGSLNIAFDDCIEPTTYPYVKNRSFLEISIPFKAWTNEQVEVRVPFSAVKRGISHIYKFEIKVNHLFGSGAIILNYNGIIKKKKLVYPNRKIVQSLKEPSVLFHGYQDVRNSLFFDPLQPVGTREYIKGDSFQHIHWKATARMQQLQTKVFPHSGARHWLLILNISEGHSINRDLEELISYTAFLIEHAVKENIPFAVAINIRTHSDIPYFYLSEGEGRIQRQKAFEILSMLSIHSFPFPPHLMLKDIEKRDSSVPIIIYIGNQNTASNNVLLSLKMKKSTIFELENANGQGVMKEWSQVPCKRSG